MGFYKSPPVLDETEQAEFDKYLRGEYRENVLKALEIVYNRPSGSKLFPSDKSQDLAFQVILDKLATPRIYLLQQWIHKRSQEQAGIETK